MTYDDILDLLDRLSDYMDRRADGDQDGPNTEMRFHAELNDAYGVLSALKREHAVLTEMANDR